MILTTYVKIKVIGAAFVNYCQYLLIWNMQREQILRLGPISQLTVNS